VCSHRWLCTVRLTVSSDTSSARNGARLGHISQVEFDRRSNDFASGVFRRALAWYLQLLKANLVTSFVPSFQCMQPTDQTEDRTVDHSACCN
jgi:hypothetical protein